MQRASFSEKSQPQWLKEIDRHWPFVFQAEYARYLRERKGEELLFYRDEKSAAVLPLLLMKRKMITLGQIQYPPLRAGAPLDAAEEAAFWKSLIPFLKREKLVHRLSQAPTWCFFQSVPEGAKAIPFGSYRVDLTQSEEEIFSQFQSRYRSYVRSAQRKGAEIRWGADQLPGFHQLHQKTMSRAGAWVEPLEDLQAQYQTLGESMALCGVVYLDGEPQGGLYVLWTEQGAYYLHGGSGAPKHNGLVKYLHWEAMLRLKAQGVRMYDFVGARLTPQEGRPYQGVQTFKARFGSELHKGWLWKLDLAPGRCKAFDTALNLKLRLRGGKPFADIIDQEYPRIEK